MQVSLKTNKKPTLILKRGSDLFISGEDLLALMSVVLSTGASFRFQASGFSMNPFIKDGDTITISPASRVKPALGRVVASISPASNRLVVHRLIGRLGEAFLLQGDNSMGQADGFILPQNILGCVTRVERGGAPVFLGQGPERYLVAFFAKNGWLSGWKKRLRRLKDWFDNLSG
jgi:hypothetical protein